MKLLLFATFAAAGSHALSFGPLHPAPKLAPYESPHYRQAFAPASNAAKERQTAKAWNPSAGAVVAPAALALLTSMPANAATPVANAIPSAFASYGHFLGLILVACVLVTERLTIKPDMTEDEFDLVVKADALYGISGILVIYTGYLRVTEYGKGWEFYAHEPIFWLKMVLLAVLGASSFFPTTKIIQRAIAKSKGETRPFSPKLVARLNSIVNAELTALFSIPLTATLMARGVGYMESLPWEAGAASVALTFGGFSYKYIKEAFEWTE